MSGKQKKRIKFQTLQLEREEGGLALPCLESYYRAAQLRVLIGWCDPCCEAKWKEIDQSYFDIPLQSMLGDQPLLKIYLDSHSLPVWITVPIHIYGVKYLKTRIRKEVSDLCDGKLSIQTFFLQKTIMGLSSGHKKVQQVIGLCQIKVV